MTSPYAGPAPLNGEQVLFGRDAEVDELQWRLVADRIIVLYALSGAGKTSLLTAKNGLLAQVSARFFATPILRVGGRDGADPVSAILSQLAAAHGPAKHRETLLDYFSRIEIPATQPPRRLLLVIDQFEEIFSNGGKEEQRKSFFRELGALLSHESRPVWAIFSMREDYFSWLDAYRDMVPTRLSNTFRLNLLSRKQAIAAVKGPAEALGVTFPPENGEDAATLLVRQLSEVRVRGPRGDIQPRERDNVEAVQLQVVCVDLWRRLSERGTPVDAIRVSDVRDYEPGAALEQYCDSGLRSAAADPARASIVRDWIDQSLLTPRGLRAPVMVDPLENYSPSPAEISALEEVHLIRRQTREDGAWYELSHDSLAIPMRRSIENWRVMHLANWRLWARAWHLGNQQAAYFKNLPARDRRSIPMTGEETYSDIENKFMAGYQSYLKQKRKVRNTYICIFLLTMALMLAYVDRIRKEGALILASNVTALQAGVLAILSGNPSVGLGARAAVAGVKLQDENPDAVAFNFRSLLGQYLNQNRNMKKEEAEGTGTFKMVATDNEYRVVAEIGDERHAVHVNELNGNREIWKIDTASLKNRLPGGVWSIALLGKGLLATGGRGRIQIWNIKTRQPSGQLGVGGDNNAALMHGRVRVLTSSGNFVYAGFEDGAVAAWDLSSLHQTSIQPAWTFSNERHSISDLAIWQDEKHVALSDAEIDEHVILLAITNGVPQKQFEFVAVPKEGNKKGGFNAIALNPDATLLAGGNEAGKIHIWDTVTKAHVLRIDAHSQAVAQLKYLRNGDLLSIGSDGNIRQWSFTFTKDKKLEALGRISLATKRRLASIATEPEEKNAFVATTKGDLLMVSLSQNMPPFGHEIPQSGQFAYLSEDNNLEITSVAPKMLLTTRFGASDQFPTSQRPLLKEIKSAARAQSIQTTFVAYDKQVLAFKDGAAEGQPVNLPHFAHEIESIDANSQGTLLVVRAKTAKTSTSSVWSLRPPLFEAVLCERNDLPINFPHKDMRLVVFRPSSSDFITVGEGPARFWTSSPGAGCGSIQEAPERLGSNRMEISAATFDPGGKVLWFGDRTGSIYPVTLDSGKTEQKQRESESLMAPSALAVSDDSNTIAVGNDSGELSVFQPGSALPVKIAQDFHQSKITSLAISKNGEWLVSASKAGTAIWDLRMKTWTDKACILANHQSFSQKENERYFDRVSVKPTVCIPHLEE